MWTVLMSALVPAAVLTAPVHPSTPPKTSAALVVAVSDGVGEAKVGDRLAYTVSVRNDGTAPGNRLAVTFTPPAGMTLTAAGAQGSVAAGGARWTVTVPAARTVTLTASARVDTLPDGAKGLAAIACLTEAGQRLCATDIDQIPGRDDIHATAEAAPAAKTATGWVRLATLAGIAAVALVVAGATVLRRRRRTR
ncbi:DUF11 domain-containing protein [Hamadaea tsunoensis]|uniref:DUF11 domain-containing protein n=1 Tax=Hamadaea tsunoensis TaxID=53368 RepID=UPI0004202A95|nr:DUF11 domain-containing protein [Hamadaea tsunoensis]